MTVRVSEHVLVPVGFGVLAIVTTWPLVWHLGTHLPGPEAHDNYAFLWNLWWARYVRTCSTCDFFRSDLLFHPFGVDLAQHTHTAWNAALAATLFARWPVVVTYNVLALGAFFLNGYVAYYLIADICRHRWGAFAGALVFQLSPFFLGQLIEGHANLVGGWTIPLFFLFYRRALERSSWKLGSVAGFCLALATYNDYYYATYLVAAAIAYLGVHGWDCRLRWKTRSMRRDALDLVAALLVLADLVVILGIKIADVQSPTFVPERVGEATVVNIRTMGWVVAVVWLLRRWRPAFQCVRACGQSFRREVKVAVAAFAVFSACVGPLAWRAAGVILRGDYTTTQFRWTFGPRGVDVASFVLGPPFHWFFGPHVQQMYAVFLVDAVEGGAWLGVAPLLLLASGAREIRRNDELRRWTLLGGAALVWALGPQLTVFGVKTGLVLPQAFLRYLPVLSDVRMPGRSIVLVYLAAAILIGAGVAMLHASRHRRLAAVAPFCIAAELVGGNVPLTPVDAPALYDRIPPGRGAVLELPVGVRDGFGEDGSLDERILYYQTIHRHPLVGGFAARLPEHVKVSYRQMPVISSLLRLSAGESLAPSRLAVDAVLAAKVLESLRIEYVVIDRERASPALLAYAEGILPLAFVAREGSRELYRVVRTFPGPKGPSKSPR